MPCCGHGWAFILCSSRRRVIGTNLTSTFLLVRAAEALLRAAKGAVLTIASTRARMSEPKPEAYAASKGGLVRSPTRWRSAWGRCARELYQPELDRRTRRYVLGEPALALLLEPIALVESAAEAQRRPDRLLLGREGEIHAVLRWLRGGRA
jgi:NAD(P)-dependent dehydrogenase (short-subunit alcohol dehydrogenase family)